MYHSSVSSSIDVHMADSSESSSSTDVHMADSTVSVDCTSEFTTEEIFPTRDDLLNWSREVGKEHGFVLVILRSDNGGKGRKTRIVIGCERSGKYRPYKNELKRKTTGTKKCECPFRLKGTPLKNGEGWKVKVLSGLHNHERAETLVGHAYAGRLSASEKTLLEDMTKNMAKPKDILLTLKDHNKDNFTTIRQIYNARQMYRVSRKGPRTELHQLMKLIQDDHYVHWHRKIEKTDDVRDIFWTHPDAINLLNSFHIVLMIDSTYNANKYRIPLLEIVGVTSTDLTFSVAFAYLESKQTDNYSWALQKLRGLIIKDDAVPQVIVTDRDIALMNAVQNVFPRSTNLLCQFYMSKSVNAKCKLLVHPRKAWDSVMEAWGSIVISLDDDEYKRCLTNFENVCDHFPDFVDYVKKTWLIPHKEKITLAWIDKVMHLGNTTTNRAEGAHERLKNLLQDSMGDLCSSWDSMNNLIIMQHTEIKESFQKSLSTVEHRFNKRFYVNLCGFVSRSALSLIADEFERVKNVGVDKSICGCRLRTTHGLPCACELGRYSAQVVNIPLSVVHCHWQRLTFADQGLSSEMWQELSIQYELDALQQLFQQLDDDGKKTLKRKLRELAFPDTTS